MAQDTARLNITRHQLPLHQETEGDSDWEPVWIKESQAGAWDLTLCAKGPPPRGRQIPATLRSSRGQDWLLREE